MTERPETATGSSTPRPKDRLRDNLRTPRTSSAQCFSAYGPLTAAGNRLCQRWVTASEHDGELTRRSRHKLARDICHGTKGTIHQTYRDGMEDQLGALGLVLNAVVLWTTRYIDAAVAQLRAEGHEIRDEDIARLSPLKHKNLNVLGRYSFTASQPVKGLRPLRDPDTGDLDDGDDGHEE